MPENGAYLESSFLIKVILMNQHEKKNLFSPELTNLLFEDDSAHYGNDHCTVQT